MSGVIFLIIRILTIVSLYAFLIIILVLLWRSLRLHGYERSFQNPPLLSLSIQQPGQTTVTQHFQQPEVIIGRDPTCDCAVSDETVSARHTRLRFHLGQWWLEDLHSKNGTRLNNEVLVTPAIIVNGDEIRCGKVTLVIQLSSTLSIPPKNMNIE